MHPTMSALAAALDEGGHWADLVDERWRILHSTPELRLSMGGAVELAETPPIGSHLFGPEMLTHRATWRTGPRTPEHLRDPFAILGGQILADTPGGRDELRRLVDPAFADLVDDLEPPAAEVPVFVYTTSGVALRGTVTYVTTTAMRVHDDTGRHVGTVLLYKPAHGMAVLAMLSSAADPAHFARMLAVVRPARRPAAVLFADLEGSSPLARRLPTSAYFALGRRLVRAADRCIVDAGGLVGRHVGDGVAAFFLAETAGSESAAARNCIEAARALRAAVDDVAQRSGLDPANVVLRFGLHWGSTPYVGQILTAGRAEVTALGDEINEAARIEACATGGRALASKALVERLDDEDATALGLRAGEIAYTPLGDLPTATDKARRDAPAIAVCDV